MAPSTRNIRYSSVMAWRARSAACSKQPLPLCQLQACIQRRLYTQMSRRCSRRLVVSRSTFGHYMPAKKGGSALGSKHRSSWGRGCTSDWDRRRQSFWHRPDCHWLNSTGDPRTAPRDKECPACREEALNPQELAPRELLWRRRLHIMKEMFEKDPYQAYFGSSNDRLKGLFPGLHWQRLNKLLGTQWTESFDDIRKLARNGKTENLNSNPEVSKTDDVIKEQPTNNIEKTQDASKETKDSNDPIYHEQVRKYVVIQTTESGDKSPTVNGYGSWKVSGRDASSTFEASGELEYDPITMRMVPKRVNNTSKIPKSGLAVEKAKDAAIQIPVKSPSGIVVRALDERDSKNNIGVATRITDHTIASAERESIHNKESKSLRSLQREKASAGGSFSRNDPKSGATISSNSREAVLAKTALEQSWLRENATKRRIRVEETNDRAIPHTDRKASNSRMCFGGASLPQKNKPLKHMSASELGRHRAALVRAWSKRREEPVAETAADRMLKEEINKQKFAMNAFENKWRSRVSAAATLGSGSSSTAPEKSVEMLQGEGDMCPNVAKYVKPDRWYKKQAPHAGKEEQTKLQDLALVRRIRDIYENFYGVIDTKHRQKTPKLVTSHSSSIVKQTSNTSTSAKSVENAPQSSSISATQDVADPRTSAVGRVNTEPQSKISAESITKQDPALYKILAYDHSKKSMLVATASSSYSPPSGEKIMSVSDALVRLHSPTKYFPYLATHQAGGYEIVSSNKNLLVLKRVHPLNQSETSSFAKASNKSADVPRSKVNPIDGTIYGHLTPQTGNFASPTGFVNHDVYSEQAGSSSSQHEGPTSSSSSIGPKVRREEVVFSGQPKKWEQNKSSHTSKKCDVSQSRIIFRRKFRRIRRAIRRIVSIGLFTALCCYVAGVTVESFREPNDKIESGKKTSDQSESKRRVSRKDPSTAAGGASVARRDQLTVEEEKIYAAAKAFVAGAILLPVVKYLFKSR